MKARRLVALIAGLLAVGTNGSQTAFGAEMPTTKEFTNSIGMKFVHIEPGSFMMGSVEGGDFDERPVHKVNITRPFYMAVTEVTNAQYEQFDLEHRQFRGKHDLSTAYDQAAIYVSWNEAVEFCEWLVRKEGLPYRLPTEAEWEYACRAGTTTNYYMGDKLPEVYHKSQDRAALPRPVDLTVGLTPANPWGLYDMHGNVEQWCYDWYGPYSPDEQSDPVGYVGGDFKVTRGGSHNTSDTWLRSANRQGTLPDDKHWLIGFRVVLGWQPRTRPLPKPEAALWAQGVSQHRHTWSDAPDPGRPYFEGPRQFVNIPDGSKGPLFSRHNHQPAITACPNGDLLAIWYTTTGEKSRKLAVAAARLRRGSSKWEPASLFWDAPDRNDHGSSIMWDERSDKLYHFNGLGASSTWENLALIMRTSTDNGASWSKARIINPIHGRRNQVIGGCFITKEGYFVVTCDAVPGGSGGSAVHISRDGGRTWFDPGEGRPKPEFAAGKTGAWIAGIHTGCTQLSDGRLLAFGRGDEIEGKMPKSISADMGHNWTYSASNFDGIGGGQRMVLERLKDGTLFAGVFAQNPMTLTDAAGKQRQVTGMFGALSYDEGQTWPVRRLITDDGPARTVDGGGNTDEFTLSPTTAE
ncbi:MAG: SUMF1/EgtB/PvdO family nonheme iron enzyme, partial [Planctomycetota bacterium]